MKSKNLISTFLLVAVIFSSCSKDESNPINLQEVESKIKDDFIVVKLQKQSIVKSLEVDVSQSIDLFFKNEDYFLLPFYSLSEESTNMNSVPNIDSKNGFKISYSRPDKSSISIEVENYNNTQNFDGRIELSDLRVIAVKTKALQNLSRAKLDIRNYNEIISFMNK